MQFYDIWRKHITMFQCSRCKSIEIGYFCLLKCIHEWNRVMEYFYGISSSQNALPFQYFTIQLTIICYVSPVYHIFYTNVIKYEGLIGSLALHILSSYSTIRVHFVMSSIIYMKLITAWMKMTYLWNKYLNFRNTLYILYDRLLIIAYKLRFNII